ncbi:hypothetical protein [Candidatus Rariloculus sp.]|uniref:hypothetical protein n=1 Tax=Candidatus Rariloculus sp. TaxID=3101265 RepID=UPI003D0B491C
MRTRLPRRLFRTRIACIVHARAASGDPLPFSGGKFSVFVHARGERRFWKPDRRTPFTVREKTMHMNRAFVRIPVLAGLLCASSAIPLPAAGDEFSWQLAGAYRDDDADTVQSDRSSLGATYHFSAVDEEAGPYELAPFLNRSSFVTVATTRASQREELPPPTFLVDLPDSVMLPEGVIEMLEQAARDALGKLPTETGTDTSEFSASGRYVWPATGWYAGGRIVQGDVEIVPRTSFVDADGDERGTELFAGKYFGSRTSLELGLRSSSQTLSLRASSPGSSGAVSGAETETEDLRLAVRHVGEVGGLTWSVSASVNSIELETRTILPAGQPLFGGISTLPPTTPPPRGFVIGFDGASPSPDLSSSTRFRTHALSGTLFPTDALGVRLAYLRPGGDATPAGDLVSLSATWFFARRAAATIGWRRVTYDRPSGTRSRDMDSVFVELLGRF